MGEPMKKFCAIFCGSLGIGAVYAIPGTKFATAGSPQEQVPALNLIEQIITLPNVKGRIDHFTADPKRKRLIVAAVGNNSVEVIDAFGAKVIQSITGFSGPKTP